MNSRRILDRTSARAACLPAALLCAGLMGCMEGPENGDVLFGATQGKVLSLSGKHTAAGKAINIQVMKAPDDPSQSDFTVGSNWVTIKTITGSSTAEYWNDPAPYYSWAGSATPVQNSGQAARWPQGGLLRFRAIDADGTQLLAFDQDRNDCFIAHASESWKNIGAACQSNFTSVAVVSPNTPADVGATPRYLSFNEGSNTNGSVAETDAYYGATSAAPHLINFLVEYGFGSSAVDEAGAVYYNAGDLSTGRGMRCKSFQKPGMASPGRACLVSNYGPDAATVFGGDHQAALQRAIAGTESGIFTGSAATVTMAYYPPITAPNSVRFAVYGADGLLAKSVKLDSKGYNQGIPQNCLTCHGGGEYHTTSKPGIPAHSVTNARFLPFDLDSFKYSGDPDYTRAAQEEAFRQLNKHIYNAGPTPATVELIEGWYGGAAGLGTPGTEADTAYVPPEFDGDEAERKVYRDAIAPYCRTCHVAQLGSLAFNDAEAFVGLKDLIDLRVCGNGGSAAQNHVMPNAEVTQTKFWASPARAYLATYLGIAGSCKPKN